jgi:catecholate siderophore receptor
MMLPIAVSADTVDAYLDGVIRLDPVNVDTTPETNNFRAIESNTGTKTATPLMDVPQTINVVDRDLFSLEGSRSLEDVLSNVAGVSPSVGDGQRDQVYIRGFAATNDEYVDGVRDSETYFRDLANIESVEVIQGPAAALYGHGSAGGIVNRVTRKPSDTPVGELDLTFGSWGDDRAELDAGGPLPFGHLSYRLDAAAEQSGGFRDQYFLERGHLSPSIAWSPSKDTRVLVQLDTLTDRRLDDLGMPALVGLAGSGFFGTTPDVPISNYYGSPNGHSADYVLAEVNSATVTVDKVLGPGWTLHDTARTEHYTLDRNNILPTGVYVPGGGIFDGNLSQVWVNRSGRHILRNQNDLFNQLETVWTTHAGGLTQKILLGLEVARQTAGVNSEQFAEAPVALVDPVLIGTPPGEAPSSHTRSAVSSDTAGLYLQDQIDFSAHLKALLGVRFDYFSVEQDSLLPPTADLYNLNRTASPRAGLVWEPTKRYSLYASVGRSFQPSGDGLSIAATNAALAPQETTNYEVGSKMNMDGGRLTASVALFQVERNISETNPLNGTVSNVGNQRTRGVELAISGHLSRNWSISAGYSLLDAAIVDGGYDAGGVLLNGRLPGLVPRNSSTLFTAYELPHGFGIGAGMVSMGGRYTSNDDSVSLPAFAVFNAVVYYRSAHWEARLNLNNVLNHRYFVTAGEGTDVTGQTVMPGAPLNLGVTLVRKF